MRNEIEDLINERLEALDEIDVVDSNNVNTVISSKVNEQNNKVEFSRKKQIEWEEDRTVAARSFSWVRGAECHLCGDIDRLWKISRYLFLQWYTANQRGGQT